MKNFDNDSIASVEMGVSITSDLSKRKTNGIFEAEGEGPDISNTRDDTTPIEEPESQRYKTKRTKKKKSVV